jgi:NADPH:quinone reductase-like Zn-dependent oxidoreductase
MGSFLGLTREQLGRDDVTLAPIMANPVTATLAKLADAAAANVIRVPITRTYGLEDVPEGLAEFATATLGKLAVRIQD